jgi:TMEM175 potassium channel family protein
MSDEASTARYMPSLDRLSAFSDGVFAIAITLLVLDITVPNIPHGLVSKELVSKTIDLWPHLLSFAITFAVVGVYWVVHHQMFRYIRRADWALVRLNLLFLFFVAIMPVPSAYLGAYGDQRIAVIIYAATLFCTGVSGSVMWLYASHHHRLIGPDVDDATIREATLSGLVPPAVFLTSIGISFISTTAAEYWWLMIWPAEYAAGKVASRGRSPSSQEDRAERE